MTDKTKKEKFGEKADVCVLIPAYNEIERIADVVERARKYARRVLVLDDGSTDGTAAAAEKAGAEVIRHPRNLGKGATLRDGFEYFLSLDLPACIVIDGDGQHEPEEIPKFVEAAETTGADIIVGNRLTDRDAMPPVRYNTNWTTSAIISWLIKQRVPDSQCGYRLIKREVLREINFTTQNYDTESELLIEAGRRGYKIGSVPIKCIYSGQVSKIDPGRDTWRFIRLVVRNLPLGKRETEDPDRLRELMVSRQLEPRSIRDPGVLEAFREVPRHLFIPDAELREAYGDHPVPIGKGQTISQPYIVALMTQSLRLTGKEKVLEVGTGSGYQAAILSRLAGTVYSVERIPRLAVHAGEVLKELGYTNVLLEMGDGTLGWPENAPYDGIIVTAASPDVPPPLLDQLAEGGRLVIPVGARFSQDLAVLEKKGGEIFRRDVCGCVFVPLIGDHGWKR